MTLNKSIVVIAYDFPFFVLIFHRKMLSKHQIYFFNILLEFKKLALGNLLIHVLTQK